jgi:hypothetical protein
LQCDDHAIPAIVASDLPSLVTLLPVVAAGLVRFASPVRPRCRHVIRQTDIACAGVARGILAESRARFHVWLERPAADAERHLVVENAFLFDNPECDGLRFRYRLSPRQWRMVPKLGSYKNGATLPRSALRIVEPMVRAELAQIARGLLWQLEAARCTGATLLAGCRAESRLMMTGRSRKPSSTLAFEQSHTVRMPWLDRLTVEEALELRGTARPCLTALRQHLATASRAGAASSDLVNGLRAEADEIEAALRPPRGRTLRDLGLLAGAIGITVFGASGNAPLATAATLLSSAMQLRGQAEAESQRRQQLRRRPGYALFEARRLLESRRA